MEPLTMGVPFRLLFVGWWMAGQSWMVTGGKNPKPSVSVSPEVVTLGGNVTVFCGNVTDSRAEFLLYKKDSSLGPLLPQTKKDNHSEFIVSVTRSSDAGIYQCVYHLGSDSTYSDYSDDVYINVTDPSIPKPSIKLKPRHQTVLGSNITLECRGQNGDLNFFLRKANTGEIPRVPAQTQTKIKANFGFIQVRREDAGSYICQYHQKGTPFVWSEPSDPVEVIVQDPTFSKPSIKVIPKGSHDVGAEVTIECQGPDSGLTFSLLKSKNSSVLQPMKAKGKKANFCLPPLRPEDAGNYTCQYYREENPFVRSEPSDPAQLNVTVSSFPSTEFIARLGVAGFVLLALGLIVAEAAYSWRKGQL